ncbi:hypothetical protein BWK58_02620 [Flavobacterium columnare]|nr:hypothetical protein BWK58_02620 [Flavobacterium columnare]
MISERIAKGLISQTNNFSFVLQDRKNLIHVRRSYFFLKEEKSVIYGFLTVEKIASIMFIKFVELFHFVLLIKTSVYICTVNNDFDMKKLYKITILIFFLFSGIIYSKNKDKYELLMKFFFNGATYTTNEGSSITFMKKGTDKYEVTGSSGCQFKIKDLILELVEEEGTKKKYSFSKCKMDFLGGTINNEFAELSYLFKKGGVIYMDQVGDLEIIYEGIGGERKMKFKKK